jgi:hypothetical protein
MLTQLKLHRLKDLETRGFILLKNIIPPSEIELLNKEYGNLIKKSSTNNNYSYVRKSCVKNNIGTIIPQFITDSMHLISQETNINCDTLLEGYYWPTGKNGGAFPWHQDHEPYYMNELNYNYLNFYIMLRKDVPEYSNLALVPFDKLSENLRLLLERRGGTQFGPGKNIRERIVSLGPYDKKSFGNMGINLMDKYDFIMRDSMNGEVLELPINFDDIKYSPNLIAGDMLIIRGDVIHKTNDMLTERLAISLRCVNKKECTLHLNKLFILSSNKNKPITTHKAKVMYLNDQWSWMLSIIKASNKESFNFADNPTIWEKSDWESLTFFQKIASIYWFIYYKLLLKNLTKNGTLFYWKI